jgi:hypothetical protein
VIGADEPVPDGWSVASFEELNQDQSWKKILDQRKG